MTLGESILSAVIASIVFAVIMASIKQYWARRKLKIYFIECNDQIKGCIITLSLVNHRDRQLYIHKDNLCLEGNSHWRPKDIKKIQKAGFVVFDPDRPVLLEYDVHYNGLKNREPKIKGFIIHEGSQSFKKDENYREKTRTHKMNKEELSQMNTELEKAFQEYQKRESKRKE